MPHAQDLVAENGQAGTVGVGKELACLDKGECIDEAHEHRMPIAVNGFGYWKAMLLERCHECKLLQRRQTRQVQPAAGDKSSMQPLTSLFGIQVISCMSCQPKPCGCCPCFATSRCSVVSKDASFRAQILMWLQLGCRNSRSFAQAAIPAHLKLLRCLR